MDATSVTHSMQQADKEVKQSLRRARDRKRSINHRTQSPRCQDGGGGRGQVSSPNLYPGFSVHYPPGDNPSPYIYSDVVLSIPLLEGGCAGLNAS